MPLQCSNVKYDQKKKKNEKMNPLGQLEEIKKLISYYKTANQFFRKGLTSRRLVHTAAAADDDNV